MSAAKDGSRRGEKRAAEHVVGEYLDQALADFSGYIAADELYDGPFCVLSIVDNHTFKRILYEVLDHDPSHDELRHPDSLLDRLPRIFNESPKPLGMVIDAGRPYDVLTHALRRAGVPVLPACDQAILSLGRYLCHRSEEITNYELQVTKPGLAAIPN